MQMERGECLTIPLNLFFLFVYGTLMPGHGNHRRIERFVPSVFAPDESPASLVDLGAFPALIPGDGLVEGVVLDIDDSALAITDQIEGYAPQPTKLLVRQEASHRYA